MTEPYYDRYGVTVHHGDCLGVLASLPAASVHAVVTDPPYSLAFMGREWDRHDSPAEFQSWCKEWATECGRVLKPGGHLVAFGGSRTWHRLTVAVEDAGFEVRDSMAWLYASGFPKSKNLDGDWQGWGTALKPAFEPIVVVRKPLAGTVTGNVLEYGVGALNIDGCRVTGGSTRRSNKAEMGYHGGNLAASYETGSDSGRWPSNVVLTHAATPDGVDLCVDGCVPGCPVADLDEQSGIRASGVGGRERGRRSRGMGEVGERNGDPSPNGPTYGDTGGASRFFPVFRFEAKAPSAERPRVDGVAHPTVKPLALMRWLVRLVTPPDGLVLDPFLGSGTTAQAARAEGFRCIGIEREESYLPLIQSRLDGDGLDLFGGDAA